MAGEVAIRFGQRLRHRRRELGLTQKQVASRMASEAVDAQRVSDWERAYNEPSERYKLELVAALEVPDVSYFYEQPTKPKTPDLFSNGAASDLSARVDEIAAQVNELHALLLGDASEDAEAVAGIAARLLQAAESPRKPAADQPASRPATRRRKPA